MQQKSNFLDGYIRIMLATILSVVVLYYGRALFIPLSFSLLIAIVLYPFCKWLENHKWPRIFSVMVAIVIVALLFSGLIWLLVWQMSFLREDFPLIQDKIYAALHLVQNWLDEKIGITIVLDKNWLKVYIQNAIGNFDSFIEPTFKNLGGFLFSLFIIPVFSILFLYHREQFVDFLKSITGNKYHERLHIILHKTSYAYHNYIIGLIKVYIIVGILNSIGLLLLGVKHAILFGMITSVMTMIPYVGIIISSLLPITVSWATTDSLLYPLGIIAIFSFVQYLENSVIFPKVVGKQLDVNSWAILIALIAGGIIWGVSGMVLFIPMVAILKIVSDHIHEWQPVNILLGRTSKYNPETKE